MAENYCYILEGKIKYVQKLPKSWGNCSGGFNKKSDAELKTYGWLPHVEEMATYNHKTHYLDPPSVDIQDDQVVYTQVVIAFTAKELKQNAWNDWTSDMERSDSEFAPTIGMTRTSEDIVDMLVSKYENILNDSGNEIVKEKYEAKKALRATRPSQPE